MERDVLLVFITLAAFSRKRNVTVWRPSVCPSVCLSRRHVHHDLPRGSVRHGQHSFWRDHKDERHTC